MNSENQTIGEMFGAHGTTPEGLVLGHILLFYVSRHERGFLDLQILVVVTCIHSLIDDLEERHCLHQVALRTSHGLQLY